MGGGECILKYAPSPQGGIYGVEVQREYLILEIKIQKYHSKK